MKPFNILWFVSSTLMLSLILMGCATTPIVREHIYSRSYEEVATALFNYLEHSGAHIHAANKELGIVHYSLSLPTTGNELRKYVLHGPPPLLEDPYHYGEAQANVTVKLIPEGENKTKVRINARIEGTHFGSLWRERSWVDNGLPSTGKLEESIFEGVVIELRTNE